MFLAAEELALTDLFRCGTVVRCKDAVSFVAIVVDVKRNFTLLS